MPVGEEGGGSASDRSAAAPTRSDLGDGSPASAARLRQEVEASVREVNAELLLRQHLYDFTYIDFLHRLLETESLASHPRVDALLASDETLGLIDEGANGRGDVSGADADAALSSLVGQQVQLCSRFFFTSLVRLDSKLLEPHLTPKNGTGWLTTLEKVREPPRFPTCQCLWADAVISLTSHISLGLRAPATGGGVASRGASVITAV